MSATLEFKTGASLCVPDEGISGQFPHALGGRHGFVVAARLIRGWRPFESLIERICRLTSRRVGSKGRRGAGFLSPGS
jgi:hypothetical protein